MSDTTNALARLGGPNWKVTGAMQTVARAPNGTFAPGWEVTYQLDSGHSGTVFLPTQSFNPEMVKQAITQDAAKLHQVVNLTSNS
jgi:hypothetical protein